jgi:Protein of unknown function (DUF2939)
MCMVNSVTGVNWTGLNWTGQRMRSVFKSLTKLIFLAVLAATIYIATPFVAAWNLREAVRSGDVTSVRGRVQWDSVRVTLRDSLAKHADLFTDAELAGSEVKPSLWQRIKGAVGGTMMDRFIDTYVTPEGLPKLFQMRQAWRETVQNDLAETAKLSRIERFKAVYNRVKRAEFKGLTKFEVEMADRRSTTRRYVSTMELIDYQWKLTGLRVIAVDDRAERLAKLEAEAAR